MGKPSKCSQCKGKGKVNGKKCPKCGGSGEWYNCPQCKGTGSYQGLCSKCGGTGYYKEADTTKTKK